MQSTHLKEFKNRMNHAVWAVTARNRPFPWDKRSIFFAFLVIFSVALFSCDSTEKNIQAYCDCVNEQFSDSLYSYKVLQEAEEECYDSLITNNQSIEDKDQFKVLFDDSRLRKEFDSLLSERFIENIDKKLQNCYWIDNYSQTSRYWYRNRFDFDGEMVHVEDQRWKLGWEWQTTESRTYKYDIFKREDGTGYYVEIELNENESIIYQYRVNSDGDYYLKGKSTFWGC